MDAKNFIIFLTGFILGLGIMKWYLNNWIQNHVLYKPGTGKIWRWDNTVFSTIENNFLNQNIPCKFYRVLGTFEEREPNKPTHKYHLVEYWD